MSVLRCLRCLGGEEANPRNQDGHTKSISKELTSPKSEAKDARHAGKVEATESTRRHNTSTRSTASEAPSSKGLEAAIAAPTAVAVKTKQIGQSDLAAEMPDRLLASGKPYPLETGKQTAESDRLPEHVPADRVKAEVPAEQAEAKISGDQVKDDAPSVQVQAANLPAHDVPLAPPAVEVKEEQATSKPNDICRNGSLAAIQAKFDSQPSSGSGTPVRTPGSGFNSGVNSPAALSSQPPTPTGSTPSNFVRSRAASITKINPPTAKLEKASSTPAVGSQKNYKWKASSGGGGYMKSAKGRAADFEAISAASKEKNKPPKQTWKRQGAGAGTGAYKKAVIVDGPVAPKKALSDLP